MTSSSIDSRLQITGPSRALSDLARSLTGAAEPFDEHFSRAAQSSPSQAQSRPDSRRSSRDDAATPEPRDADSDWSLPDDSHLYPGREETAQTKYASAASPDKGQQEEPQEVDDVVEISDTASTQTPSVQLSEEDLPLPPATQPAGEEPPTEEVAEAPAGKNHGPAQTADSTAGQPNRQPGSRENQPGPTATSQPATPELTAEAITNTEGKPAAPNGETATAGTQAGTLQAASQDAPAKFAALETESPNQTNLPPAEDPPPGSRASAPRSPGLTEGDEQPGAQPDTPGAPPTRDRQAASTPSRSPAMDRAADAPRANNTDPASPTSPTHVVETATPVSTDSVPSSGIADRALDQMTAARPVQPARQASEPPLVPTVDHNRFVGRVSSALRLAQRRDGQMQLRLSPPELGSLRLEISVKQGVLTATMETETAAARHILLENLPTLRERLAGQEIRIERFDVDLRHESGDQSQKRAAQEGPGDQPQGRSSSPGRQTDQQIRSARVNQPLATHFQQLSADGLDVVI